MASSVTFHIVIFKKKKKKKKQVIKSKFSPYSHCTGNKQVRSNIPLLSKAEKN